jgi:hypothetical protein
MFGFKGCLTADAIETFTTNILATGSSCGHQRFGATIGRYCTYIIPFAFK